MSATFAPSHWPAHSGGPAPRRELGQMLDGGGVQWLLKPNCSMSPRQLAGVYLSLCVVGALISGFFYAQGAPWVAAFAGLELLALGTALLVFARHTGDREIITLAHGWLHVQRAHGSRTEEHTLALPWLAVEPAAGQGSLVQLRGRGQQVRVGRFLRPDQRNTLALELRQALRRALAAQAGSAPEHELKR
jgi:uncharacterized membrane protein